MIDQVMASDDQLMFSANDLRNLFKYRDDTACETHEKFKCKRCRAGKQFVKAQAMLYGDASSWDHYGNADLKNNQDDLLRAEAGTPDVSFVFQYLSH